MQGPFETLEYIISQGAEVTSRDNLGKTPLHLAASAGLDGIKKVRLLVDNGCSVNVEDYKGHTPMHDASVAGETDCVKYLAQRGATGRDEDAGGGLP